MTGARRTSAAGGMTGSAGGGMTGLEPPSPWSTDRGGDGLPVLPSGEPILARWFVIAMLVLVPVGLAVIAWAFLSISRPHIDAAARRPPGSALVTHDRGDVTLNQIRIREPGPGCASGITMVGDDSARAALRRALGAVCQLVADEALAEARIGLERWTANGGAIRMGVFGLTGVDGSARLDDGRILIELNAKFQFEPGARAAPVIVHELVHIADGMPGRRVGAEAELTAMQAQQQACERLAFENEPPRACRDAAELISHPNARARLETAGYPVSGGD